MIQTRRQKWRFKQVYWTGLEDQAKVQKRQAKSWSENRFKSVIGKLEVDKVMLGRFTRQDKLATNKGSTETKVGKGKRKRGVETQSGTGETNEGGR